MKRSQYLRRAREVIDIEVANLRKSARRLGAEFTSAVDVILKCLENGGKIVVTGMGKNLHIAQNIIHACQHWFNECLAQSCPGDARRSWNTE